MDSSTQHGSKRQKTCPLTTVDIPAIVKAARDGLPKPTETSQDSDDLEDTQDTDVAISDSSDEFGPYNLKVVYNCVCVCISRHTVVCRAAQEAGVPHREYINRKKENAIFTPM